MEQFATSPALGEIAAKLLGVEEIYLWHDQVLYKPGSSGAAGNVGWHQDKALCTVHNSGSVAVHVEPKEFIPRAA